MFNPDDAEAQNELHTLARSYYRFERFVFRVTPLSDNNTLLVSNESIIVKSADEQVILSIKFKGKFSDLDPQNLAGELTISFRFECHHRTRRHFDITYARRIENNA